MRKQRGYSGIVQEQGQIFPRLGQGLGRLKTTKNYGFGFLLSSVLAVLIVIVIVLVGEYTKTRGRFLLSSLMVEGYFFCGLWSVWALERRPESRISQVAFAAAAVALLMILTGIWATPNSDAFWKSTAIITLLAFVFGYLAVLDTQEGRLARSTQAKSIVLATVIAGVGIAADVTWPPYWWVFTLAVIAWVSTLTIPIFGYLAEKIQRR